MQLKESRETKAFFMVDNGIVLPPMDEIPELHIDSEPANEEAKRMLRKAQKLLNWNFLSICRFRQEN